MENNKFTNMKKKLTDRVSILKNGITSALFFSEYSGRIIYRNKIDTIIGIKHPGIILGEDFWGTTWVIHNHYENGQVEIVTWDDFAKGESIFFDNRDLFYAPLEIVERAITFWIAKKEYNWLTYNCQHFVNDVTQNTKKSETIENLSNTSMIAGGIMTLFGLATKNKTLMKIGIGVTTTGAIVKGINRI
jgi:hypothetical protein